MIKSIDDKPANKIEIDLTGPQGNAFKILAFAKQLCRELHYDTFKTKCILDEMMLTDYEGLIHTFDREFGSFVILYRWKMSNNKDKQVQEIIDKIKVLKQETVNNVHKITVLKRVLIDISEVNPFSESEYMIEVPKYEI